jgi:integrase
VKVLNSEAIVENNLNISKEYENFEKVFNLNYAKIFSRAEYALKEKRQLENRMPLALPPEMDLVKLKNYLNEEIERGAEGFHPSDFVHFRKVAVSRITILNGRRGSEAARLTLKEFSLIDQWIDQSHLTNHDKSLLAKVKLAFSMGKGSRLVPLFIPSGLEKIMNQLSDTSMRKRAGILPQNEFVFAYKGSMDPVTGYNELLDICNTIKIANISATKVRHRLATIFWETDGLTDDIINEFCAHLGHSKEINKQIYATPPALKVSRNVLPLIQKIDQVRFFPLISYSNQFFYSSGSRTRTTGHECKHCRRWNG